jgi:hypothetical protein
MKISLARSVLKLFVGPSFENLLYAGLNLVWLFSGMLKSSRTVGTDTFLFLFLYWPGNMGGHCMVSVCGPVGNVLSWNYVAA